MGPRSAANKTAPPARRTSASPTARDLCCLWAAARVRDVAAAGGHGHAAADARGAHRSHAVHGPTTRLERAPPPTLESYLPSRTATPPTLPDATPGPLTPDFSRPLLGIASSIDPVMPEANELLWRWSGTVPQIYNLPGLSLHPHRGRGCAHVFSLLGAIDPHRLATSLNTKLH